MSIFAALNVYYDIARHSAAINMAIDEVLLESAAAPAIRFYSWEFPALSFGYFGRFADVADKACQRDLVRRWTGGGIVFHGEDLTYAIVIPRGDPVFSKSSGAIYAAIHSALRNAFVAKGERAELLAVAAVCDRRTCFPSNNFPTADGSIQNNATVTDCRYNDCFANPVQADVVIDGRKVAGAAQRRTRAGLLQQGSIQEVDLGNGLAERFAKELSNNCKTRSLPDEVQCRAQEIAARKYGTEDWLRKQ